MTVLAGLTILAGAAIGMGFTDRLIFVPPPPSYGPGLPGLIRLSSASGDTIAALYHPVPGATSVVLFAHGNAEDVGHGASFVRAYAESTGSSVLAFDYPGYGLSTGVPSERGAYQAADAALAYLLEDVGVTADQVIAHGRSLGGAVLVDLASREPVAGLVVESSFVSAFRVLTRAAVLPFDRFRSLEKMDHVRAPVLVIHGERDDIIEAWHGRSLYDAIPPERRSALWVPDAGHNDLAYRAGDGYWRTLSGFARSLDR